MDVGWLCVLIWKMHIGRNNYITSGEKNKFLLLNSETHHYQECQYFCRKYVDIISGKLRALFYISLDTIRPAIDDLHH